MTEWSENAPAALPPDRLVLHIDRTADGEDCRRITLSAPDDFPCGPAAAFPAEEEKGASGAAVR